MRRINAANATPDNRFKDADPSTGGKATSLNAAFMNDVQESLMYPLDLLGRTGTGEAFQLYRALIDSIFRVGDYRLSEHGESPAVVWNWQTWVEVNGRGLVGFDGGVTEFNLVGKEGGARTKTLSVEELPSHGHDLARSSSGGNLNTGGNNDRYIPGGSTATGERTKDTGGGQAFSLLNPYRVVKIWRRTA